MNLSLYCFLLCPVGQGTDRTNLVGVGTQLTTHLLQKHVGLALIWSICVLCSVSPKLMEALCVHKRESEGNAGRIRAWRSPVLGAWKQLLLCFLFTHLGTFSSFLSPCLVGILQCGTCRADWYKGEFRFGQCVSFSGGWRCDYFCQQRSLVCLVSVCPYQWVGWFHSWAVWGVLTVSWEDL